MPELWSSLGGGVKPRQSFAEMLASYSQILDGAKKNAAELKGGPVDVPALEQRVRGAQDQDKLQEELKAKAQEATDRLLKMMKELTADFARLRNFVFAVYGRKNEKLEQFGIKPSRSGGKKGPHKPKA